MSIVADQHFNGRQCGRVVPKSRPKALRLGEYIDAAAVDLPKSTNRREKAAAAIKRMYLNAGPGARGDCVIADRGHELGLHSGFLTGTPIQATDQEIAAIYRYFSPWDKGCVITQVLDYQQANGLKLGGQLRKIDGYIAVNFTKPDLIRVGIELFGTVVLGCSLREDWYNSTEGATWDVSRSAIVGGHDVAGIDYDETGVIIATWGGMRTVTWAALAGGDFDEAYLTLAPEWYDDKKIAASGLAVADLQADLAKIGAGTIPPIASVSPNYDWSEWV